MSGKPVRPRERARRDVEAAIDYYTREAGAQVALRFIAAPESAYRVLSEHLAPGSPRYDHELALPGLRSCRIARFSHLVFYVERDDHIDVWRVLHAQRDIPAWLQEPKS
ncbi:MAG TPA: type II toxin-antitoxin system RelE/ParE family toxin [Rhizomicrobium sp.]